MIAQSSGVLNRGRGLRHGLSAYIGVTPVHLGDIPMTASSSDVAFTPSVKAVQTRKGSRTAYAAVEGRGAWRTRITPQLALGSAKPRPTNERVASAKI